NYQGKVIMIDDSLELGLKIQKRNDESEKNIISVVFNGPLTCAAIEREDISSNPELDFYVAKWDTIPEIARQYT
ncbi:MAG: hypothetical protein Q8M94_03320, partial [Ignavibacteria bacterium]|nr:hypothetical protein [Ignavibacteria bacterium]